MNNISVNNLSGNNLILTSAGFSNKKIEKKFLELANVENDKIKVLFIPTAAITKEQKYFIPLCKQDLLNSGVLKQNIITFNLDREINCDELKEYNVIYVCGGNTQYLLDKINETGFNKLIKIFLNNNGLYVGVSAGSIVMTKKLVNNLGYINCNLNVHAKKGAKTGNIDTNNCPNISLTDNQAIIITNNEKFIIE